MASYVLSLVFFVCFYNVSADDNDVLTLNDFDSDVVEDRRRPVNEQEKDILLLDALARRKGSYHGHYGNSQEDDSIMDLLGKSELFIFMLTITDCLNDSF